MSYRILCTPDAPEEQWRQLRHDNGIGASEAAAILGDTNWGSPLTVWQEKTGEVADIGNERMRWGKLMEPVILGVIAEDYPELGPVLPSEGLLQSVEHPHLLGTLDSVIDSPIWGEVPLEIKNVSGFEKKNWFDWSGMIAVPPKYTVQVRQQAFVRNNAPGGYVAALFDGNELEIIWVPRSQSFVDNHLTGTLADYWNTNVLGGVVPDPIIGDDLASLWPADTDAEPIIADELYMEMRERWIDAKQREKTAKGDIEALAFYFGVVHEQAVVAVDEHEKPVMKMPSRRGQRRVLVATHEQNHPDCTSCVTRDRDSRSPQAVIDNQGATS